MSAVLHVVAFAAAVLILLAADTAATWLLAQAWAQWKRRRSRRTSRSNRQPEPPPAEGMCFVVGRRYRHGLPWRRDSIPMRCQCGEVTVADVFAFEAARCSPERRGRPVRLLCFDCYAANVCADSEDPSVSV